MKKWQSSWDREEKGRHLYSIQQKVGKGRVTAWNRREEIIRVNFVTALNLLNVVLDCQKYERERIKMKESIRKLGVQGNSLKGENFKWHE